MSFKIFAVQGYQHTTAEVSGTLKPPKTPDYFRWGEMAKACMSSGSTITTSNSSLSAGSTASSNSNSQLSSNAQSSISSGSAVVHLTGHSGDEMSDIELPSLEEIVAISSQSAANQRRGSKVIGSVAGSAQAAVVPSEDTPEVRCFELSVTTQD
jgi:hypothetical protein